MIGRIQSIVGIPSSGLRTIHFEDGKTVAIGSGFGMRQLAAAFGVARPNEFHRKVIGRRLEYEVDDFGVLLRFKPAEEECESLKGE